MENVTGLLVLNPPESKRLIARAVVQLPQVKKAFKEGWVIVANGTTTAYIAEELLGKPVDKFTYAAGYIGHGKLSTTPAEIRQAPFIFHKGELVDTEAKVAIRSFGADDVFIKGANAIDPQGHVGILMANDLGGTIGMALGTLMARGAHLIVPVGLEKLVPSVPEAAKKCGIYRVKYSMGDKVGLMVVHGAEVVTEIEALKILAGVEATMIAAGGIGESQGAVVLLVEGPEDNVRKAFEIVEKIKGEPPVVPSVPG